jgi:hypothetical protein
MKRTFFTILMGINLIAAVGRVQAQSEDKPLPHEPYLAAVPDYAHWTVTMKYETTAFDSAARGDKPPVVPSGYPSVIDTIKTGDLRSVLITFADGTSKQFTCQGDWVLASTPKGPQLTVATPTTRPYVYYTRGFVLLDGVTINASTYKDVATHNGRLTFYYKSGDTDAWIDIGSMLPLTVKKGGIEADYEYLHAPPRPFLIPADQASLLQKEQGAYQSTRSLR